MPTLFGGGIYNHGTSSVSQCVLEGNSVNTESAIDSGSYQGLGGGIYNSGILTVSSSVLTGNFIKYTHGTSSGDSVGGICVTPVLSVSQSRAVSSSIILLATEEQFFVTRRFGAVPSLILESAFSQTTPLAAMVAE